MTAPSPLARRKVREYAEGNMNAQITILRGALTALDPATGLVGGLAGATTVYTGKARIHTVSSSGNQQVEGGPIAKRDAVISIPIDSPVPFVDDLITVQKANLDSDATEADVDLDTRVFRIIGVDGGTYFGDARRMDCSQLYSSRDWTGS